ncbi:MAG: hypothetical protein IKW21_08355 [Lachnospiraceae bacterium]|nr:hypothetical protein [Lachnospiraceae bacterium]
MEELWEIFLDALERSGYELHVDKTHSNKIEQIKNASNDLAQTRKMLFDAHVNAGFTREEALKLVLATIKK